MNARRTWAPVVALAALLVAIQPAGASDPWAKLRRPLHIPRIVPGERCPVTPLARNTGSFRNAQGSGPVYPIGGYPILRFIYPVQPAQVYYPSEWSGNKVLWIARSDHGPVLVRGRQLDGPNELRFELAPKPAREMRWTSVGGTSGSGWLNRASTTRVRAPGCYAWQVDGTSFSRVIVFRAVVVPGA